MTRRPRRRPIGADYPGGICALIEDRMVMHAYPGLTLEQARKRWDTNERRRQQRKTKELRELIQKANNGIAPAPTSEVGCYSTEEGSNEDE